jgi:hypothetical protein
MRPLREILPQILLVVVLLEGPYHALVTRRATHQANNPTNKNDGTSNHDIVTFPVYMAHVGHATNPHENYRFFDLPFCTPTLLPTEQVGAIPSVRIPDIYTYTPFFPFRVSAQDSGFTVQIAQRESLFRVESCTTDPLTEQQVEQLSDAIQYRWFYIGFLSGLPFWGTIGEMLPGSETKNNAATEVAEYSTTTKRKGMNPFQPHVYTQHELVVARNAENGQVVKVDYSSNPKSLQKLQPGQSITFTLTEISRDTNESLDERWDRYLDLNAFRGRWFYNLLTVTVIIVLYKIGMSTLTSSGGGSATSEGEMRISLLLIEETREGAYRNIFLEPPRLPLLAGLVGAGVQLLLATWIVVWFVSFRPFSPFLLERTSLEFLSVLISRIALLSLCGCFVSAKIVLLYASSSNVQGQALEAFRDELQLESNIETDSTDGIEDGFNDDAIYVSKMIRCAIAWVGTVVGGFHIFVVTMIAVLVKLKGTVTLHANDGEVLFAVIITTILGVVSGLMGVFMARQHTIRNPENDAGRSNPSRSGSCYSWYQNNVSTTAMLLLFGAVNFVPIFSECGLIFRCAFGYTYYHGSIQTLISLGCWIITVFLSTQMSLIGSNWSVGRRIQDWQWMAFINGASVSIYVGLHGVWYLSFQTQIHGWYEIAYCLFILLWITIDIGLICGGVSYLSGRYVIHSVFHRNAE